MEMFPDLKSPGFLLNPIDKTPTPAPPPGKGQQEHGSCGVPWQDGLGDLGGLGSPTGGEMRRSVSRLMAETPAVGSSRPASEAGP